MRQFAPKLEGEVVKRRFNEGSEQMGYRVAFVTSGGTPGERWFLQSDVEEMASMKAAAKATAVARVVEK